MTLQERTEYLATLIGSYFKLTHPSFNASSTKVSLKSTSVTTNL